MKPTSTPFRNSIAGAIIAATLSLASLSQAGNGTWNVDASGNWSTPENWDPMS